MSEPPPPPPPPSPLQQPPVSLYLAKSVRELNRRAERNVAQVVSVKAGSMVLMKLFKSAEVAFAVERDEERAYIMYMRMLLVYERLAHMHEFSRQRFDCLDELQKATSQAEMLAEVLRARYDSENSDSRRTSELATDDELLLSRRFTRLDSSLSIDAPSTADAQSVVSGGGGGGRVQSAQLLGLLTVDAKALYKLMISSSSTSALIVFDLRSCEEFAKCQLKNSSGGLVVHIDGSDLKPGFTAKMIEYLVRPDHLAAWHRVVSSPAPQQQQQAQAAAIRIVLVPAWHRAAADRLLRDPDGPVAVLRLALMQSPAAAFAAVRQPSVLSCGLHGVASAYPTLLTDPTYCGPTDGGGGSDSSDSSADQLRGGASAATSLGLNWRYPTLAGRGGRRPSVESAASAASAAAASPMRSAPPPLDSADAAAWRTSKPLGQLLQSREVCNIEPDAASKLCPQHGPVAHGLTGLRNLGNSCYMNCVLQCLNNTPVLAAYFLDGTYRGHVNKSNPLGHKGAMANHFALLSRALWCGAYTAVSPVDLREAVDHHLDAFDSREQQDAQEFLLFLLDGLHEDLNRARRGGEGGNSDRVVDPPTGQGLSDRESGDLAWLRHKAVNDSVIVDLFQGQFKSTLTCDVCHRSSITFDAFMYFSVPVVSETDCTLADCLEAFLKPEQLIGSSQWFCPYCRCRRDAAKKIDLWRLPPCLLVHLKRFRGGSDGSGRKLTGHVDFPLTGLDPDNSQAKMVTPYSLYAVCNHYGGSESGHYIATCLNALLNRWHTFDDESVAQMEPGDVASSAAYILFYSRL